MRIATLIIGLLVGALLFIQSFTLGAFSSEGSVNSDAAGAGFGMALLWLLASALVIAFPRISMVLYALSALIGIFTPTGAFEDLRFHGGVAVVLTVMAFFGWRGKKKHDEEVAEERFRQHKRDMMLEQMMRNQAASGPAPIGTPYSPSSASKFSAVYEPKQASTSRPKWMSKAG